MRIIKIIAKLSTVCFFQVRVNDLSGLTLLALVCRFVVPGSARHRPAMGYRVPGAWIEYLNVLCKLHGRMAGQG